MLHLAAADAKWCVLSHVLLGNLVYLLKQSGHTLQLLTVHFLQARLNVYQIGMALSLRVLHSVASTGQTFIYKKRFLKWAVNFLIYHSNQLILQLSKCFHLKRKCETLLFDLKMAMNVRKLKCKLMQERH